MQKCTLFICSLYLVFCAHLFYIKELVRILGAVESLGRVRNKERNSKAMCAFFVIVVKTFAQMFLVFPVDETQIIIEHIPNGDFGP